MMIKSCKKRYKKDTHRVISPEETLKMVEPLVNIAGIKKVIDITNIDRVGIPVFSSIRSKVKSGTISAYSGKGISPTEAKVSAIMEGFERYSAEVCDKPDILTSFSKLSDKEVALDPRDLILPQQISKLDIDNMNIPWMKGYDLINEESIFVPMNAVVHPLDLQYRSLFRTNTNGLASGNELEEAIFHGLAEVVERDAWSLVEVTNDTGDDILIDKEILEPLLPNSAISSILDLIDKFNRAGIEIKIKDITSDVNIPTFAAASDDTILKDPALLMIGVGTHTNAEVAIIRALTETAQSRATQIYGAREDTTINREIREKIGYERMKKMNSHWFKPASTKKTLNEVTSLNHDDFLDDINYIIGNLKKVGIERVIFVDLTRKELNIPVVRVIVPGLEEYAVDSERMGDRCKNAINNHLIKDKIRS
ncbi:MAG: YcaO-related McrA-glycine thioamidation protein [Candidatus Methanoliparum thermophilum]|uniref:YcaO-related McrA-glycine thioamidation protein n=1 Tax=Methanoliparum thermophilum TaxID=2491083 RepID=A0A520KSE4_METT2|nr:YcaO-related McrA-glycine thioamidation protein [Candidatus Methanoliparum sp. LAM-1]RZN64848.1 MAG: YcaO-related McrA-glycine thioamidation protein [Candidatus Methanoliparum thermophilum]BDC36280.1 methanogenesis marker 1 protein [Candidatus Methanoliparum sp. LAM-1]